MSSVQVYFAFSSGAAISLVEDGGPRSTSSFGGSRLEINMRGFLSEPGASQFWGKCLNQIAAADQVLVGVNAYKNLDLENVNLDFIGKNRMSALYKSRGAFTRDALKALASRPYGEFFVAGLGHGELADPDISELTDADAARSVLGDRADVVLGYDNEFAVLTVLSSDEGWVKGLFMDAASDRMLGS